VKTSRIGQIGVPAAIVSVVVMMVVPLPPALLDLLLVLNLSASVVILLTSMFVAKALDFSVFPSLLLIATLFRLALNVSATRLVLLHGYAGKVIESFGHFVIGGSIIVGLVVFLILIIIQFVVITNGAGRVAEVGARFTLDAMPGKQMAIDADLNSGLITEDEARKRRAEVSAEADFYGAMDGGSKFVKGDAIAAIVITLVNLLGGFVVGVVQNGMDIGEAIETYSLLTVGDGLVSQIPALLISVASGLIVTRAASQTDMGTDLLGQIGNQERPLKIAAVVVAAMAIIPGIPKVPFLFVGAVLWFVASRRKKAIEAEVADESLPALAATPNRDAPEELASDMRVDPLELEIGFGLMDLVDADRGGDLLDRVRALRRKIAMDLGIVIPPVRTRDNLDLPPNAYLLRVHGVEVGRGEAPAGSVLLLGARPEGVPGTDVRDPVFGLEASWVPVEFSQQAELAGETVVDRASVLTAHMAEVVRQNATRLISRQDIKLLVDSVKATDPVVVDELNAAGLALSDVQAVIQNLLDEQVGVRDLVRILESVSERGRITKDPESLTEAARNALGPAIGSAYVTDGVLSVITLDPLFERGLLDALRAGEGGTYLAADPGLVERLAGEVATIVRTAENQGRRPALVCAQQVRSPMRRLLRNLQPTLPVLAYSELPPTAQIETVGVVNSAQPAAI
jgi:flagellar biosynthesis protein FlhA